MPRRRSFGAITLVLLLSIGCNQSNTSPSPTPAGQQQTPPQNATPIAPLNQCIESVVITGGRFQPERLTVPKGCAVMFTNRDDAVEQIAGPDFTLGEIGKDQSWVRTYREAGTFEFHSTKSSLKGTITVLP